MYKRQILIGSRVLTGFLRFLLGTVLFWFSIKDYPEYYSDVKYWFILAAGALILFIFIGKPLADKIIARYFRGDRKK